MVACFYDSSSWNRPSILGYNIAYFIGRFSQADSAALAAHYGSVSVVTFMACEVLLIH